MDDLASRTADLTDPAAAAAFEEGRIAGAGDMERIERQARADELEAWAAATLRRANEVRADVGLDAPDLGSWLRDALCAARGCPLDDCATLDDLTAEEWQAAAQTFANQIRERRPGVITEALRGPWIAVLADRHGFVYDSVEEARESAIDDDEMTVTVVRGSAAPNDRNGTTGVLLRLPGSYQTGDVAYALDDVYLDDDDPSVAAEHRYAQAKAMAAGLNQEADRD